MTIEALKAELAEYKNTYWLPGDIQGQNKGFWLGLEGILKRKATPEEVKVHQAQIRKLKQAIINAEQEEFVIHHQLNIRASQEDVERYNQLLPLVLRRKQLDFVREILGKEPPVDGELFSFSEPEEIVTTLQFCNCGAITKSVDEMTNTEQELASEHLGVCSNIRTEQIVTKAQVSSHKIGHWDCRACYREPLVTKQQGVMNEMAAPFDINEAKQSTQWCPRFLRPFRNLTPEAYSKIVKDAGCYGGILHKQISVILEGTSQYLLTEFKCDTCGYYDATRKQIQTSQPVTS